jgi:hypothetical protein
MLFTVLIGIPLGIVSAIRRGGILGYAARLVAILGLSIPNFWLGTLMVLLPAIWWRWNPAKQWVDFTADPLGHIGLLILPALVLGIVRAWAEPEPFLFNGRYTKLRYVNVWPRPIQKRPFSPRSERSLRMDGARGPLPSNPAESSATLAGGGPAYRVARRPAY